MPTDNGAIPDEWWDGVVSAFAEALRKGGNFEGATKTLRQVASRTIVVEQEESANTIKRLEAELAEARSLIGEVVILCALGDIEESTEAFGWGDCLKAMKAFLGLTKVPEGDSNADR